MQVSVRDLKNHLSKYLHLVSEGEKLIVTSHQKPLAKIEAIHKVSESKKTYELEGVSWNGKKPKGSSKPIKIEGVLVSDMILEDRR